MDDFEEVKRIKVKTQVSVFHDDLSIAYLVPSDEKADEVLKAAFGDRADFDGTSYILKPGISRKKDMVPAITDVLKAGQKNKVI